MKKPKLRKSPKFFRPLKMITTNNYSRKIICECQIHNNGTATRWPTTGEIVILSHRFCLVSSIFSTNIFIVVNSPMRKQMSILRIYAVSNKPSSMLLSLYHYRLLTSVDFSIGGGRKGAVIRKHVKTSHIVSLKASIFFYYILVK
jgi:hypothetical protein